MGDYFGNTGIPDSLFRWGLQMGGDQSDAAPLQKHDPTQAETDANTLTRQLVTAPGSETCPL